MLYANTIHFTIADIIMEFLVDTIELIAFSAVVIEVNRCFTVTIHTPSHAQLRELEYFIHLVNITVTGLALHITGTNVL